MKNETTGSLKKKGLSATAPVFKFAGKKGIPIEARVAEVVTDIFSQNPESQEYTNQTPFKGKGEKGDDPGKREKEENKGEEEKLVTEDDLYLAALLLEGETDDLSQDPPAVSITIVNNHPFNSIIIPNFWDPSEKHDSGPGNWCRDVWSTTVPDPSQRQNEELSSGLGPGTWGQHPACASASLIGFQQYPSVNSGPLVRYTGNQTPSYPGAPGHIYPLPIVQGRMHPGLGPQPLYPQVHHIAQRLPSGPQGYPQGPSIGFYTGTEMVPFSHATFVPPYAPFPQHPGFPLPMLSLSQEMSQLHALQNEMNQGNRSRDVSNQHSPGQGGSNLPPLPDLDLPERYEQEDITEISESHYADITPTGTGDGDDEPEIKSRGVFLRGVPRIASHLEIFQNIRGGAIDQVSFQDREGPLMDVNIFFTTHEAAKAYVNYVTNHGGIFWYSERLPSEASLIPSRDPGFLNIDEETAKAIAENFTRCISISRIPPRVSEFQLRADIQSQTRRFRIDYEAFEFRYVGSSTGRTITAEIKFPSVKICMASIETLKGIDVYKECIMTPIEDGCAGPLSELEGKWRAEYEWCKSQGIFRDQRFPIAISRGKEGESNEKVN